MGCQCDLFRLPKIFQIVEEVSNIRLNVLGDFIDHRIDVALRISNQYVTVHHHKNMAYGGLLHQSLAQPIIIVSQQHRVSFMAFIAKAAEEKGKKGSPQPYRLCINIYGTEDDSGSIGVTLDNAGIYLQHPLFNDLALPYLNPHYLVRPGASHPESTSRQHLSILNRPSLSLSDNDRLKSDILQVMDTSAQGPSEYRQITPSDWLQTPLKP